jgi:hypothetical protein
MDELEYIDQMFLVKVKNSSQAKLRVNLNLDFEKKTWLLPEECFGR